MNLASQPTESSTIAARIRDLADRDPVVRECARIALVTLRSPEVTAALVAELSDPRPHVRWEASKALVAIGDPIAAPALLHALDDEDEDIRWVAAEGLIVLGKVGLIAVLHALTKQARSSTFCRSAHHVLHTTPLQGFADIVAPVVLALEQSEPAVSAPPAAWVALTKLKLGTDSCT